MARLSFGGGDNIVSKPVKRMRWATTRKPGEAGANKRRSIFDRIPKVHVSAYEEKPDKTSRNSKITDESPMGAQEANVDSQSRTIYVNVPVPDEAKTEEGYLKQEYPRNKVRTAKYTALSFIPKNLYFQFQNVANDYFLFLIILDFFSIFGGASPGLNAVPLIFIVTVTAIKDAIEDWRRTMLDTELNNTPVYRLVDWTNVNSSEDHVSAWRRFKKACTRTVVSTYRLLRGLRGKKDRKGEKNVEEDISRRPTIRESVYSDRTSFHSVQSRPMDDIAMTPMGSPGLRSSYQEDRHQSPPSGQQYGHFLTDETTNASGGNVVPGTQNAPSGLRTNRSSAGKSSLAPTKNPGSLVDPLKQGQNTARFKKDYWKSIQVGDFVRIYNDEPIPADVLILATSDPDGACYIETKNLDGETNLKVRQALQAGQKIRHARDCERAEFVIESEGPHPNLYQYSAVARWQQLQSLDENAPRKEMAEPVGINNLLLRGCNLKNTEWVLGIVLFTGFQTKIMLNSGETPSKRARLSRSLNWNVVYNFIILFFMCLVAGIVQGTAWRKSTNSANFFEFGSIG